MKFPSCTFVSFVVDAFLTSASRQAMNCEPDSNAATTTKIQRTPSLIYITSYALLT